MEDPWKKLDGATHSDSSREEIELPQSFDDNFEVPNQSDSIKVAPLCNSLFQPLEDSESYLANLERKLSKLKSKTSVSSSAEKRDLLLSLSGARDGHIDRLINSEVRSSEGFTDFDLDAPVEDSLSGSVIRYIAPQLQALTAGELVHLLQSDQLDQVNSTEDSNSKDTPEN